MPMIYTGGEYSEEELFREVRDIAQREKITEFGQYKSIVDETVEDKNKDGLFDPNEDVEKIKESLLKRWQEVADYLAIPDSIA